MHVAKVTAPVTVPVTVPVTATGHSPLYRPSLRLCADDVEIVIEPIVSEFEGLGKQLAEPFQALLRCAAAQHSLSD